MKRIKNKHTTVGVLVAFFALFLVMAACSTEKNTFINRTYHSTTAKYNGYFNAKELLRIGLEDYRKNYREDYNEILPIELLPNEEDVVDFYPIVDTAIAKCQAVISKHSMPTSSKPSKKKTEYAKWIDQNWFIIGKSHYIRRDYEKALKNFEYIRKFYVDRPSTFTGQLWEAKTLIQMGELAEATRSIQKLETRTNKVISADAEQKKKKKRKKKLKYVKSKSSDDDEGPGMPKNFDYDLAKVKAMLALAKKDTKVVIEELRIALEKAPKKEDIARLSFILGQLLEQEGNPEARDFYSQSIKKNAPFEMSFNAKINRAVVSDLNDQAMIEELEDLAKEDRYMEFRDQIYFAMAKVELARKDRKIAKYDLSKSVFYSLNNPRQKGVSYEKLGDLSFEERNYVFAQRYYDSSANVIPETYFNYEVIRNKADKLANLVRDIDVITFEDSVQRIANMDEKGREQFLKGVIKQIQKEEQEKKERDALRAEQMRKLQQTYAEQNQSGGSKWYFSNLKAQKEGMEEFRRIWGQRENEDYWRLSKKPARIAFDYVENDTIPQDSLGGGGKKNVTPDKLTVEDLMTDIPLTDTLMKLSNERLLKALYSSGMIYKEQLDETQMGAVQFQRVLNHNIENEHNVLSAFQLYTINSKGGNASQYENYILNNYPNSDYANFLRDPDYFIKKKERDALALKDYLRSVTRFEQGLFYPVILKAERVIEDEPENTFRKEYFLLRAMAMGQINRDKTSLLPVLEQAILEYPGTDVAIRSQELIDLINDGVPAFEEFTQANTEIFKYDSKEFYVVIILDEKQNSNTSANSISNFNRDFFSRSRLSTSAQVYDKKTSFVLVKDFKSTSQAQNYVRDFKRTKQHIANLKDNELMFISRENFKVLLQQQKLAEYRVFFGSTYK